MKRLALLLMLLFMTVTAHAATRYVSDELEITVRSGPTTQHRILKMLNSGTPLEVLEENADGWSRVRVNGQDGWTLSRYLMNMPSARERLERFSAGLSNSQQELVNVRQELDSEREKLTSAQAQIAELITANDQMKLQLGEAERGLLLSDENKELKKQIVDLQRGVQDLNNEIDRLSDRSQRDWFVAGAGVVVAGFLAGIVVTRIRWRRKTSSWSSL